jgi:hypothetical protein
MNKNTFNSYLCTLLATVPAPQNCCGMTVLSQHNHISQNMCFDMMCKMMM